MSIHRGVVVIVSDLRTKGLEFETPQKYNWYTSERACKFKVLLCSNKKSGSKASEQCSTYPESARLNLRKPEKSERRIHFNWV